MTATMDNVTGINVDLSRRERTPRLQLVQGVSEAVKLKQANPGQFFLKDTEEKFDSVEFTFLTAKELWWLYGKDGKYEKAVFAKSDIPEGYSTRKPEDKAENQRYAMRLVAIKIAINDDYARPVEVAAKKSSIGAWLAFLEGLQNGGAPVYATKYKLEAVGAESGPHFVPKITAIGPLEGEALNHAKQAWMKANEFDEEVPF